MRTTGDTGAGHGVVHEVLKYVETYGSNTSVISSEEQKKHGRKSSTSPEQELFMVLARTRCGLLLQNLARRYGMWTKNVSRIRTTWLNHLHQQLRDLPIWPTLNGKPQLSLVEETTTRKVASVRVLVGREISRITTDTGSYIRWFPLPWPMILTRYALYVHIWHYSCPPIINV